MTDWLIDDWFIDWLIQPYLTLTIKHLNCGNNCENTILNVIVCTLMFMTFSSMASSSHHTGVAVQPPAGQYPGTHGTASVVIGQPQQHFASSPNKFNSCYSRVSSILFGFLQIALFAFSIAGAIMVVINEGSGSELGTGFWCGTVVSITISHLLRIT